MSRPLIFSLEGTLIETDMHYVHDLLESASMQTNGRTFLNNSAVADLWHNRYEDEPVNRHVGTNPTHFWNAFNSLCSPRIVLDYTKILPAVVESIAEWLSNPDTLEFPVDSAAIITRTPYKIADVQVKKLEAEIRKMRTENFEINHSEITVESSIFFSSINSIWDSDRADVKICTPFNPELINKALYALGTDREDAPRTVIIGSEPRHAQMALANTLKPRYVILNYSKDKMIQGDRTHLNAPDLSYVKEFLKERADYASLVNRETRAYSR